MTERGERIISDQIAYYRARAPEYDATFRGGHDPELIAALDAAAPRGTVLELACGTGAWTQTLVRHAVDSILAVDAAPEMLAIHAQGVPDPRITRVTGDIFSWRPDRRFDFVTFAFWLSHVPPARHESFWQVVEGALADRGRVFLVDQDERGLRFEQPTDDPDFPTVARPLLDGRVMSAIKVYHRPAELAETLAGLGWKTRWGRVGHGHFWAALSRI